ncbi:alpha/beta hydrolase [Virgibacillus sp. MSJ-26]|uniref:alpha/beta fold hydrolase n=1 Tax=Virgibacillus sp. MSJ-26 TaxID=2841522 RepID=UPI001C10FFBD|nr:alpha/beta hydrolase [Virgibacillus sp. MSJ-26]MBU5467353.1 alpha/beta hydrolase [Virgibacillus sp. MSJ-26]
MKFASIYKTKAGKRIIQESYENYLKLFDVPFERIYVETRYGKTHTLVTGPKEGKPLFILQGGNSINPMTLAWFKSVLKQYRVYAPDTIGHPGFSAEMRLSGKNDDFSNWISDIMDYFSVEKSAFIGPSFGGGIILRLATYQPQRIACAVLVAPSGIKLGSKIDMIRKILWPLALYKFGLDKGLSKIAEAMSDDKMKKQDEEIIGNIFKHVKLEQQMPKLTKKRELLHYRAPTLVIAGEKDVFFPAEKIMKAARRIIPNLVLYQSYNMGHFPPDEMLASLNSDIADFLTSHY